MAAVSNLGDNGNLTGSIFGQSNTYGFGRLAWDPALSAAAVNREWTLLTFGVAAPAATVDGVVGVLEQGWETYENYTSPLGIGFVVNGGYGGGPCMGTVEWKADRPGACHSTGCTSATKCAASPCHSAEDRSCPKRWLDYLKLHGNHYWMDPCSNWGYSNYTHLSIGCDRTSLGSGYAAQYPAALTKLYDDPTTCPEELLLFYHHLPWAHELKSGLTIAQHIVASHAAGLASATRLHALWKSLGGINAKLQEAVAGRFELQIADAQFFAQVLRKYYEAVQGPQPA